MFCRKCGAKLEDNARFCGKCGSPLSDAVGSGRAAGAAKKPKGTLAALLILAVVVLAAGFGIFGWKAAHKENVDTREEAEKVDAAAEEAWPEAEAEEQPDLKAELMAVLENISYYGDKSQCAMTAEQASAYAQLIADGLAGKSKTPEYSGLFKPVQDAVCWDKPYEVAENMYGTYLTDRANIMLADFAGDGNPLLYIYSSMAEDSYEVYGWEENTVKLVINQEGADRVRDYLFEDADGKVKMCRESSSGAGDSSVEIYLLSGGTAEEIYSLRVMEDGAGVHCIENGEETLYPVGSYGLAYEKMQNAVQPQEEHVHIAPYTCFYEMQPSTLSDMMEGLKQYASGMAGEVQEDGRGQGENGDDTGDNAAAAREAALEQYRQFLQGSLTAEYEGSQVTLSEFYEAILKEEGLESIYDFSAPNMGRYALTDFDMNKMPELQINPSITEYWWITR